MSKKRLTDLHPDLLDKFHETYDKKQTNTNKLRDIKKLISYIDKVIPVSNDFRIAVTGCGPSPLTIKALLDLGYSSIGVEPINEYVEAGNKYLNRSDVVLKGRCEEMPFTNNSIDVVLCQSVLEHVDSPVESLEEFYRVLKPGGIAYIETTNKTRFSLSGNNNEFNVPFYNWFPKTVKEAYINKHLNDNPKLANYTPLPAVHWFTYSKLCELGRNAGFGKFYNTIDVIDSTDSRFSRYPFGKSFLPLIKSNPWLKGLFLRQFGGIIYMYKRP